MTQPLADLLRPQKLSEFVGQEHLVGKEGIIRKLLNQRSQTGEINFPSLILWGPPGSGKTTLARLIAKELKREFFEFSAVNASIKEIEKTVKETSDRNLSSNRPSPVVIIDEIHRYSKSQQAKLLPWVETGKIILIGARPKILLLKLLLLFFPGPEF